ncbi:MAG: hypothetical protein R3C05_28245 [Pirellulaceae bacterium]
MNQLQRLGTTSLPFQRIEGEASYDVNGDRLITPLDALNILNWLNRASRQVTQPQADASSILIRATAIRNDDDERDSMTDY